jgi:hypothetical protein
MSSVVNAFAKAKERTEVLAAAKGESCAYFVGRGTEHEDLGETIRLWCNEHLKAREALARAEGYEKPIREFAERVWVERLAQEGIPSPSPLKLVNADGSTATFVVQDRTASTHIDDKALTALSETVGPEAVAAAIIERTIYSFDPRIMGHVVNVPGRRRARTVESIIGERLMAMTDDLVVKGVLTADEAGALIVASSKRTLSPGFVRDSIPPLCEHKAGRIARAIAALGSAVVRFLKPA